MAPCLGTGPGGDDSCISKNLPLARESTIRLELAERGCGCGYEDEEVDNSGVEEVTVIVVAGGTNVSSTWESNAPHDIIRTSIFKAPP